MRGTMRPAGVTMADTIAAIATGNVISAIGIVRISGENAISAADRLFRPLSGRPMAERPDRTLVYGGIYDSENELLDMCLCTVSRAPNTYTGEDTAEFQCHGSPMVLRSLLDELMKLGVRQAKAGEFTKRAFLNGKMELTSAEAVADLIDAETPEMAKNAAGQLSGAISRHTDRIYSDLTDICSHFHAVLDYPDEDIEPFVIEKYRADLSSAGNTLSALLKSYSRGRLMNSGIPAVIAGRPNAGKSSLLNSLLGYERAIVTPVPGTTRDTISERVRLGSVVLCLEDTAGIRETENEVERLGVERSKAALERAELVLAVVDGASSLTEEDLEIISAAEKAPNGVVVITKDDLPEFGKVSIETSLPVVEISSYTGDGIELLEKTISSMFPMPVVPAGEILTNSRQAEAVKSALEYIDASLEALEIGATPDIVLTEVEGALNAIGELSGRTVREDVTNRIFARFCVGK